MMVIGMVMMVVMDDGSSDGDGDGSSDVDGCW